MVADLKLHWVLKDPGNERAVDPLGMGGQAERIADMLLPDISVATTRARYLSFFCWAIQETEGEARRLEMLHRWEAALALKECKLHPSANGEPQESPDCPDVVGIGKARRYLRDNRGKAPRRPETLYKTTAFSAYRPLMRSLGLLQVGRELRLTVTGTRLARAYRSAGGKPPRCLSEIGGEERSQIRKLLGLDLRTQCHGNQESRRKTYEQIRNAFAKSSSHEAVHTTILWSYRAFPAREGVARHIHRAYAWETLSLGLSLAFAMILKERGKSMLPVVFALRRALRGRPRVPELDRLPNGMLSPNDDRAAASVVALLREARRLNIRDLALDQGPHDIAACLVKQHTPEEFTRKLIRWHEQVKAGEAWVTLQKDRVKIQAPEKSRTFSVRTRTYRLDAFRQLVDDLGMLP